MDVVTPDLISVIIPTVSGREANLEVCTNGYLTRSNRPVELIVIHDRPTCGVAWQEGADQAHGEFIHLTADDLEPHVDWDVAAVETVLMGYLPSARVLGPRGEAEYGLPWGIEHADWTPCPANVYVPFMSVAQWLNIGPMFTGHYYTDNWIADRGQRLGYQSVIRRGYSFTHHWAQPARGAGMGESRMGHDHALYEEAWAKVDAGGWTEPWPIRP